MRTVERPVGGGRQLSLAAGLYGFPGQENWMFGKWMRFLLWQPFALMCRRFPLWPFRATITHPVEHVICIRIDNLLTTVESI